MNGDGNEGYNNNHNNASPFPFPLEDILAAGSLFADAKNDSDNSNDDE